MREPEIAGCSAHHHYGRADLCPPANLRSPQEVRRRSQAQRRRTFKDLPAFCRISATSRPASDSEIKIEVWMPASGWNGKFRGTGNGGLGGNLSFGGMVTAMHGGFATAAENTGHEGGSVYALSHPEKIIDFGDRAAHEMTVTAKAAIAAFYGSAPKFSYMDECGGGSIAALKESAEISARL